MNLSTLVFPLIIWLRVAVSALKSGNSRDDRISHPEDLLRSKALELMEMRRLQADDICVEEVVPELHFFDVNIRMSPGYTSSSDVCEEGDQVLLGHDLNLMLLAHGLGELLDDDNVLGLGGVCPFPTGSETSQQRRKLGWGFVWRGGFTCGFFCSRDDSDDRRKLQYAVEGSREWFDTVYIPNLVNSLTSDIHSWIVPKHTGCLGSSPTIEVELVPVEFNDFSMICDQGEAIEFLDTINLNDFALSRSRVRCGKCNKVDFSVDGADRPFEHGDWVNKYTWKDRYGMTLSATAPFGDGYVPNGVTRVFDSNSYGTSDKDLRSPHYLCPGGGPGDGTGGAPGQPGEKCHPLGNVLIIQDFSDRGARLSSTTLDNSRVDESSQGGIIKAVFDKPVLFSDVGVLDVTSGQRLAFTFADGTSETFTYEGFGSGAAQRVIANMKHVTEVEIVFRGDAAVTELSFCDMCETVEEDDATCESKRLIAFNTFEDMYPLSNWFNGKADTDDREHFSRFLGRFVAYDPMPYKIYDVPAEANSVSIDLDFYQIDSWISADTVFIEVDNVKIPIGPSGRVSTLGYGASTQGSVSGVSYRTQMTLWGADLGFSASRPDKIHHITLSIPKSTGLYNDGKLKLLFDAKIYAHHTIVSAGWDNILVEAHFTC